MVYTMFIPAIYGEIGDGLWHDYQHYPKIACFFPANTMENHETNHELET